VTGNDRPSHDLDPLMREALGWVVRLRSGDVTTDDIEAVKEWRAQSPDHEDAFRQAALLWRDLQRSAETVQDEEGMGSGGRMTRRALLGGAIAASTAAYLVYQPPLDMWPSLSELVADYRTGKGERRDLALGNGVAVTLNTQTSITVNGTENSASEIELITGEAAITTTRGADSPLVVRAHDARILVTQASINARCIGDRVSVTCLDGQVNVEFQKQTVQLAKGQEVNLSPATGLHVDLSRPQEAAAWRDGLLIIRERPLYEVVEEVNRYRGGRLIVTNDALGRRVVSGTFHLDRLNDFAGQVRQLFGANVRSLPGGIVLLS
jgi:transmembrane sensor